MEPTPTTRCCREVPLHAVLLHRCAIAVGKQVADIDLESLRVELRAIRRNGQEIEHPASDWVFRAGDILLIVGKPRRVENAEAKLLQG